MVLEGDFYKEGGDPNSIHAVSLYIYISLGVCSGFLWKCLDREPKLS